MEKYERYKGGEEKKNIISSNNEFYECKYLIAQCTDLKTANILLQCWLQAFYVLFYSANLVKGGKLLI